METAVGCMVGAPGFEPGTSCAQGKRATRLRHAPTRSQESFCQASRVVSSVFRQLAVASFLCKKLQGVVLPFFVEAAGDGMDSPVEALDIEEQHGARAGPGRSRTIAWTPGKGWSEQQWCGTHDREPVESSLPSSNS
jgi:hypothetical protein